MLTNLILKAKEADHRQHEAKRRDHTRRGDDHFLPLTDGSLAEGIVNREHHLLSDESRAEYTYVAAERRVRREYESYNAGIESICTQ